MIASTHNPAFWEAELRGAKLPDERFRPNLIRMCCQMQAKAGHSFSAACGPAVRKSAHRLFSNESSLDIQQGHRQMTRQRCQEHPLVLVVEDTTDLNFSGHGHTQGLGNLGGRRDVKGLSMHSALALSTAGEPLGLVGQHIWAPLSSGRSRHERAYPIEQKESYKWIRTKQWVNDWWSGHKGRVLVVGDREADFYEHFAWPREPSVELLVRAAHLQRRVHHEGAPTTLGLLPQTAEPLGQMSVEIPRHRDRQPRTAHLQVRVVPLSCPPPYAKLGPSVPLTLVHVLEQGTQGPDEPIEWFLLTTLLVGSYEQACRIVGFYALRWVIERFHFVLKQGMNVERLQFDSFTRLKNALQVCSLVAWQLLWTARIAKVDPQAGAGEYFGPVEIEILEQSTGRPIRTTTDYVLALGRLSGFVKSKIQPLPGEKLLWQSIKLLEAMKTGYLFNQQNYGT